MSLWKVTIKNSRYVNGVRIERGMSVQVPSTVHPLSSSGLSLVRDAFIRIYGVEFAEDASISGGANLILDKKARLMVNSAVTVNVEDGGIVSYDMDVSNKEAESYIYLPSGGDLNFAEGSTLNINVDGDLEAYTEYYKYILYADNIAALYDVYSDILVLYENGDVYFSNNGERLLQVSCGFQRLPLPCRSLLPA